MQHSLPQTSRRALLFSFIVLGMLWTGCASETTSPETTSNEPSASPSHPAQLAVDGDVGDWDSIPILQEDPAGDGGAVDLAHLTLAHSDRYLFLRLAMQDAVMLQQDNDLTLHLDLDANPNTGGDAGEEVSWTFGERGGRYYGSTVQELGHADLGFTSLPTVTVPTYEIALDRTARPGGQSWLSDEDELCVIVTSAQDRLPDQDRVCYTLSATDLSSADPPPTDATIARRAGTQLRVVSYNVRRDDLFNDSVRRPYERVLRALDADILALQEVYDHDAMETLDRVADLTGATPDDLHAAKAGLDLTVVSTYPILDTYTLAGFDDYRSAAYLLDTETATGRSTLVINMHPPCCTGGEPSSDLKRQRVVDAVAAFLRDLRSGEAPIDVPDQTPVIVTGDMNFVGDAQQPRTLSTGDIVNRSMFGAPSPPDWDGTDLLDVNPAQTGAPLHTTWVNPNSSFPPGRLDYAYVTDSVLDVDQAFVLSTTQMDAASRSPAGLEADDTATASDHLPVVVDVSVR